MSSTEEAQPPIRARTLRDILFFMQRPKPQVGAFHLGSKIWPGLSKLVEECGEVLQVLGKLMQKPDGDHWSGPLRPKTVEELGDLYGAICFFVNKNLTHEERVAVIERGGMKMRLFEDWHRENQEG